MPSTRTRLLAIAAAAAAALAIPAVAPRGRGGFGQRAVRRPVPVGKKIAGSERIVLRAGDSVTVLDGQAPACCAVPLLTRSTAIGGAAGAAPSRC